MIILQAPPCSNFCISSISGKSFLPLPKPSKCFISTRRRTTSSELQTPSVDYTNGAPAATLSPSSVPAHKVTVHDRFRGVTHEFTVPEDQYILHTAEDQNISLPFACRHGCCTSCAVRIKSGEIRQPEALGISAELKSKGYALLCVGFPSSDIEVETQDEDEKRKKEKAEKTDYIFSRDENNKAIKQKLSEYVAFIQVYWLQFGRYFARGPIERDDYALELALGDE